MKLARKLFLGSLILIWPLCSLAAAASKTEPVIRKGDRVAIIGDSITQLKLYSKFIEAYLVACEPQLNVQVLQMGHSGEKASGFLDRMDSDLLPWHPTVATVFYGMNDGKMSAYDDEIGKAYRESLDKIVDRLGKNNVRVIVAGPGVVDTSTFEKGHKILARTYNMTLGCLSEIAADVAKSHRLPFVDVHSLMLTTMEKTKAVYGQDYLFAGIDGVHPADNGQTVIAYAFLKAAGFDGSLATITLDFKGKAHCTEGHQVVSEQAGKVTISSQRYPFCFYGPNLKDRYSSRGILPFVSFQQDLNRFELVVRNLPAAGATVQWGEGSKHFTAEQLSKGINLAAEFLDNPFSEPFHKVLDAIKTKQAAEVALVRDKKLTVEQQDALQRQVNAAVVPVQHEIEVIPDVHAVAP